MRLMLMLSLVTGVVAAETKVKLESLPPAVQNAIREQTKNATIVGLSKEKEDGKIAYEVETKANGRTRDLLLDSNGAVLEVEEEVDIKTIPAAAKAAIEKRAGAGTIQRVETVTKGSTVSYEAAIKTKMGRTIEVNVNGDGSIHK